MNGREVDEDISSDPPELPKLCRLRTGKQSGILYCCLCRLLVSFFYGVVYQRTIVRDICQEIIAYGIIVLAPLSRRRFCLCINPHESTMTIVCRRRQLELAIVRLRARRLLWVTKIDNRAMPVHLPPSTSVSGVQII